MRRRTKSNRRSVWVDAAPPLCRAACARSARGHSPPIERMPLRLAPIMRGHRTFRPRLFLWSVDAAVFLTRLERDARPRASEIYKKTIQKRTCVYRATTTTIPRALIRHLPTYSKPIKYVGHRTKLRYGSPACCRFRRMARKIHPAIKKLTRFSLSSNLEKALKYLGRNAQKDQRGE